MAENISININIICMNSIFFFFFLPSLKSHIPLPGYASILSHALAIAVPKLKSKNCSKAPTRDEIVAPAKDIPAFSKRGLVNCKTTPFVFLLNIS